MALDFPANPVDSEIFGSYIWSASKGVWQSREESAAVAITSPTAPLTANNGDIWYNTARGIAYVYYDDGSSSQWVEVVTSGTPELSTKADLSGATFTGNVTAPRFISTQSTGTSPFEVNSATAVTNLNADLLDGNHASAFAESSHNHDASNITSGTLSQDRGGTGQSTLLAAIQALGIGDYAAKAGPSSYVAPYRVNWAKGYGIGSSLNWSSYTDGIYVNTTGHYEVWGVQRGAQTNYSGIGISGNRTTLETRTNGIWSHDHAGDDSGQGWSKSYFLGELYAGELVTFGGAANNMTLATSGFAGFLSVKRLR
jgi:hypothetical protein